MQCNPNSRLQPAFLAPLSELFDNTDDECFGWPSQSNGQKPCFDAILLSYTGSRKYPHTKLCSRLSSARVSYTDIVIPTIMLITVFPPLQCLMFKLQPSGVLVLWASRAICPCDRDTNDDPDRNDTGSCCHSCKRLLQVLVPLTITLLYPGGLIFLIRSQLRL